MLGTCLLASGQSSGDMELSRDGLLRPGLRNSIKLMGAEEILHSAVGASANSGVQPEAKAGSGGDQTIGNSSEGSRGSVGGAAAERELSRGSQVEFWTVQGVMFGTTIAAIATTYNCLQAGSCTAIPVAFRSRGAMYSVGIPMAAGVAILSYEMEKHGKHWWFVPSAIAAGAAGLLTYHSARASH
jgi:hypothetical protein